MKENKALKVCIAVIITILILNLIVFYPVLNPYMKKAATLNAFSKDEISMKAIAQEWNKSDYTYMFTDREKYKENIIHVGNAPNDNIIIDRNKDCLEYLLDEKKYRYIMKSDNAIYFTKYASFGNGYGIAFSVSGDKPQNEFIISSEKLKDSDGWYFYIMR